MYGSASTHAISRAMLWWRGGPHCCLFRFHSTSPSSAMAHPALLHGQWTLLRVLRKSSVGCRSARCVSHGSF